MNTYNLGLSVKSTKQLERMIDDAAFLSSPLHFLVGMAKMLLASAALVAIVIFGMFFWLFRSHDLRAELTKNFASEQAIYRIDLDNGRVTPLSGTAYDKDTVAKAFDTRGDGYGDGRIMKGLNWTQDNWLSDKSDEYARAYITASHNISALYVALYDAASSPTSGKTHFIIPNVPAVEIAFLRATDEERRSPANAHYNWLTGICEVGHCTDQDFVPRNDSIFYDAVAPQMTPNQAKAIKDLYATGSPEFWIAAAHANGIFTRDEYFAAADAKEQAEQNGPSSTPWTVDEYIYGGAIAYAIFVLLGGIAFTLYAAHRIEETKRTAKS